MARVIRDQWLHPGLIQHLLLLSTLVTATYSSLSGRFRTYSEFRHMPLICRYGELGRRAFCSRMPTGKPADIGGVRTPSNHLVGRHHDQPNCLNLFHQIVAKVIAFKLRNVSVKTGMYLSLCRAQNNPNIVKFSQKHASKFTESHEAFTCNCYNAVVTN